MPYMPPIHRPEPQAPPAQQGLTVPPEMTVPQEQQELPELTEPQEQQGPPAQQAYKA